MMQKPGNPEELPDPWDLWVRVATMAALEAAISPDDAAGFSVRANRVTYDDFGGNEFRLALIEADRAVLYGCDNEMSRTRGRKPPLDLLAGAPGWLPREPLADMQQAHELGFVYWYDGAWERIPYPAEVIDDGLASTAGKAADMRRLVRLASDFLLGYKLGEQIEDDEDSEQLDQALAVVIRRAEQGALVEMVRQARERALSAESFAWLGDHWNLDIASALRLADRAGLTPGSVTPRQPRA
jgi:hypothetical protein